jgi:hypothetical protein
MALTTHILLMPQWLSVSLLVGVTVAFSIAGFMIVHFLVPAQVRQIHNDVAGFVFATLGVTYGVLLAFVVFVVWDQYNEAKVYMENDDSALLALYQNIDQYPDRATATLMKEALLEYVLAEAEMHALRRRGMQFNADKFEVMEKLWNGVETVSPQNDHEKILYQEILSILSDLAKYRSLRVQAGQERLPGVIWVALIGGGIVTIGFTCLFGTKYVWAHIIIMSLLSSLIAIVIYVIVELNYPSLGVVSISLPEGYRTLVELTDSS